MLIGEIAKRTGFTRDTIRWYEKIGLITPSESPRGRNNYRNYDIEAVERLIAIRQFKSLGFTLKETGDLFLLEKMDEVNCNNVSPIINTKVELINQKISELEEIKQKLNRILASCEGNCREVMYR